MHLVTSYTREKIEFDVAPHIAPSVMSVALNNARNPSDLKLVPYEQVLRLVKQDKIMVVQRADGFVCQRQNGLTSGNPCNTAIEAMIAYWARQNAKQTTAPRQVQTASQRHNQAPRKRA